MRKYQTLVVGLTALLLLVADAAQATTFILMEEDDLLVRSDAVVLGTVTQIESAATGEEGGIHTYVSLEPEAVLMGDLRPEQTIVLKEAGGTVGGRSEWVFGAPEFWVGERALVFMSRNGDGTLHTTAMAMGKYSIGYDAKGEEEARRDFGYGTLVLEPRGGQLRAASARPHKLARLKARVEELAERRANDYGPGLVVEPPEVHQRVPRQTRAAFALLGSARWFEPDDGGTVPYLVDSTGDTRIGAAASLDAVMDALAVWSSVAGSSLQVVYGGASSPAPFNGCSGGNRVTFNDPYNEISNPSGCSGILAIGGYCSNTETRTVNGHTFNRIVTGKVTFNNGWSTCSFWTSCNLAEVSTHEIGHSIGFGHTSDGSATMAPVAHFDGRCAGLTSDDIAAARFVYPGSGEVPPGPTRTPTETRRPTRTATVSPTRTATVTSTVTRTRRPTSTRTSTVTRRPTVTSTPTRTRRPTRTPTVGGVPTSTLAARTTMTATRTRIPTRTSTPTSTRRPSRTRTPTRTPVLANSATPTATPSPTEPALSTHESRGLEGHRSRLDRIREHAR
jgi:hypothetical protein